MNNKIKAVLIDVDDCFLPTNGEITDLFFAGLIDITRKILRIKTGTFAPKIGWCSGRDRNYIEAVSFFCGLPDSWSVIESGVALFNPTTKEMALNPALTTEVKTAFEIIRRERLPQILDKFPDLFDYPGNMINIALERRYGAKISIEECFKEIESELKDLTAQGLATIHHSTIAIDISPAGIDKASGIQFLSQKTKINTKNILGIGDSRGDFPMLNLVGYVGCPTNASKECKELVRERNGYVSPYHNTFGVADIIDHFCPDG